MKKKMEGKKEGRRGGGSGGETFGGLGTCYSCAILKGQSLDLMPNCRLMFSLVDVAFSFLSLGFKTCLILASVCALVCMKDLSVHEN